MQRQAPESVRVYCPWCKRPVTATVPRGGDGTGFKIRRHVPEGKNVRTDPPCEGCAAVVVLSGTLRMGAPVARQVLER